MPQDAPSDITSTVAGTPAGLLPNERASPLQSEEVPDSHLWEYTQQFNPKPDKVYLVNYTTLTREPLRHPAVPMHCAVAIFLETPTGNGTFTLESVGEPYVGLSRREGERGDQHQEPERARHRISRFCHRSLDSFTVCPWARVRLASGPR